MRAITLALFVAMFLLVSYHQQGTVQAYLDPGTGSMAVQLLIAGLVGALATLRLYWARLKAFFVRRQTPPGQVSEGH